jgi:exopolysaccharide production protein ExoY
VLKSSFFVIADQNELSRDRSVGLVCKRFMDVVGAVVLIFALAPLFLAICVVLTFCEGGPILFRQTRIGRGGRPFSCYKFRSMVLNAEAVLEKHLALNPNARREWAATQKLAEDPRITWIGCFLRKSSLDELPQLYNVLLGDMSFVGPRPIVPQESSRYQDNLSFYLSLRPGLTGLWQISGRSKCSYPERVALDVQYVREWSLSKDCVILLRTIPAVLSQRGSW